jgi:hypothetical protein
MDSVSSDSPPAAVTNGVKALFEPLPRDVV